jgi:osmoprotectant transport system substrate-binding protein
VNPAATARRQGPLVPPANLRRDLVLAAAGFVALVVSGLIAHNGKVSTPERLVFRAFNELPGWLYPVLWPVQQLGNLVAGPAIAVIAAAFRRWRLALGALIVSFVDLEPIIKSLVVRRRPGTTVTDAILRGDVPVASQSFPSGHAVLIASLAVIAAPYFRGRWRLVPWLLVAGVCIGRIYVGAHNPLDVIAGAGLGLVIGAAVDILVHLPIGPRPKTSPADAAPAPDASAGQRPSTTTPATDPNSTIVERRRHRRLVALLGAGSLVFVAVGCGGSHERPSASALQDDAITVGSFDFAESRLLAEIYSQALEGGHYPVHRAFGLGPREFVAPALSRGLLELVPEYAGTALQFLSLGADTALVDTASTHDALTRTIDGRHLTALMPSPAQNANTFVVTGEVASRLGLHDLSDVARVAPELRLGGPPECPTRPTCEAGLREVYGLEFKAFVPLDAGGPITRQALREGDVDVALLFTTDPAITSEGLVPLVDDRGLQPAENVTPLLRTEVVERWGPDLVALLDRVSGHLTTDDLRRLNAQVDGGATTATVAADWLTAQGLS